MHTSWLYFLVLIFSTCFGLSAFGQGISMSPTRLFFTGEPGAVVSQTITISNSSDAEYVFNINTKDWKREENGNKIYFNAGSIENSNAFWISTSESSISIPAKMTKDVVVTMEIPKNGSTSVVTNSMLFFTQIGKQQDKAAQQTGIGIITLFEFGIHVYHTPEGNEKQSLDIVNFEDETDDKTNLQKVAIGIINDGNLINDATVELEFTNTNTGEEIKLEPINISMLPGAKQVVKFQLPEGLSGNYLGVTIVKMAGINDLRVGEKDFEF